MLYSYKGGYPSVLPFRIYLPDGSVRTDPSSFSEEELLLAGYKPVEDKPSTTGHEYVTWNGEGWVINVKTQEQIDREQQHFIDNQWTGIREKRDRLIREFEWRYLRHHREVRLGLTPKDKLEDLDSYVQQLADITKQPDVLNIIWPVYNESNDNV